MFAWFANADNAETVAFAATLFCVWLSAFWSFRIPRQTPGLFLALVLIAMNWCLLVVYYLPGPPQDEILSGFSGLLLIYAGVLLFREGAHPREEGSTKVDWRDKVPLFLLRTTVGALGLHLIALRVLHRDQGFGTLAQAVWGTVLTVLGYAAVWKGVDTLYRISPARKRASTWLGALLLAYSLCEVSYAVWYARVPWPAYQRYSALRTTRNTPDFEERLPFVPQPDWPEADRWQSLPPQKGWPPSRILALKVEPRLARRPLWMEYAFAALKVLFTSTLLLMLWRRPTLEPPAAGKEGTQEKAGVTSL